MHHCTVHCHAVDHGRVGYRRRCTSLLLFAVPFPRPFLSSSLLIHVPLHFCRVTQHCLAHRPSPYPPLSITGQPSNFTADFYLAPPVIDRLRSNLIERPPRDTVCRMTMVIVKATKRETSSNDAPYGVDWRDLFDRESMAREIVAAQRRETSVTRSERRRRAECSRP